MLNYPLRFEPILKKKIWGGNKLKQVLNKPSTSGYVGESWEISGLNGDVSIVANGPLKGKTLNSLSESYKENFLGKKNFTKFGTEFPLLIKFIDAHTELSVQLHPGDDLARKRHNSFGKTEMWYIVQADPGAEINIGFNKNISKEEYIDYLDSGSIIDALNFEKVKKGDSFFIQTGKVHAIGAGVLLAEIQQSADITYRIYDWDRLDEEGKTRELHTDMALDAIDFRKKEDFRMNYSQEENRSNRIVTCEYFTTNFLPVRGTITRDYSRLDSFVIYMCVNGKAKVTTEGNTEIIETGQTLLIPAQIPEVKISSDRAELLEIFIE